MQGVQRLSVRRLEDERYIQLKTKYEKRNGSSGFIQKFLRTFQGPPTRNLISQFVQKCTFPVHSNTTLRLELFPPPTSAHFSVLLSSIDS